ncbi:MAG: hypothetical protein ABWY54_06635 [Glaciihabitans sp.]
MPSVSLTPDAAPDAPVAVVLPGSGYTIQGPLLYWSIAILKAGGWHVRAVEWSADDLARDDPTGFAASEYVESEVEAAFAAAPSTGTRLVVAKSLGSFALPWALANDVPGVWLTPVLTVPAISDALRQWATPLDLVVGGTADAFWRPEMVRGTAAGVLELANADHSLVVPGDARRSRSLQEGVFDAVERHADALSGRR